MLVDRHSGAQRELLAAPVPRPYLVLSNLIVALGLAALQVAVPIGLSAIRGGAFHITGAGVAWFVAAALLFIVFMYGVAETLASKVTKQEDYVGATPAVAILRGRRLGVGPDGDLDSRVRPLGRELNRRDEAEVAALPGPGSCSAG